MKKFFLLLALLSAAGSVAMAADSQNAVRNPNRRIGVVDPDLLQGQPVMVMMSETEPDSPDWYLSGSGNFFVRIPPVKTILVNLQGDPWSSFSFVIASPDGDINAMRLDLWNLNTGEHRHIHHTQAGPEYVPVSDPYGTWWIVIKDVSGVYYSGKFTQNIPIR